MAKTDVTKVISSHQDRFAEKDIMLVTRISRRALLGSAALLVLAACGDGGTQTQTGGESGNAGEMVFRRSNGAEPSSLDPHFITGAWESAIIGEVLMGLTTEDAGGKPIPGAAERWETSADGLVWTFHLRDHIWSDGTPVTAEDFLYAWRRMLDPKTAAPYASILYIFKNAQAVNTGKIGPEQLGIRAIDARTLELTLENPAPYLAEMLTHATSYPLPRHVVEAKGRDWTKPENYVANGPYRLAEWIQNDHITLRKNAKFYDAANVKIDQAIFYPVADPDAGLRRFRAGELDTLDNPPASQIAFIETNFGDMLHREPYLASGWLELNMRKKPFGDICVRQALNLAYDRETMANKVIGIGQPPAYSIIPSGIANYPGGVALDFKDVPYPERVTRAAALMREAGYGPDKRFKTTITTGPSNEARRIAAAVQEIWRAIYVDSEIVQIDAQSYSATLRNGDFDIAAGGWIADFNDARNFLYLLMTGNEMNYGRYSNPAFDALIAASDKEQDLVKRGAILADAERLALHDVPWIPTRFQVTLNLVRPYVKGWITNITNTNRTRWLSVEKH